MISTAEIVGMTSELKAGLFAREVKRADSSRYVATIAHACPIAHRECASQTPLDIDFPQGMSVVTRAVPNSARTGPRKCGAAR